MEFWSIFTIVFYIASVIYCLIKLVKIQAVVNKSHRLQEACPHPNMHLVILLLAQVMFLGLIYYTASLPWALVEVPVTFYFLIGLLNYTTAQFSYDSIRHWN